MLMRRYNSRLPRTKPKLVTIVFWVSAEPQLGKFKTTRGGEDTLPLRIAEAARAIGWLLAKLAMSDC